MFFNLKLKTKGHIYTYEAALYFRLIGHLFNAAMLIVGLFCALPH